MAASILMSAAAFCGRSVNAATEATFMKGPDLRNILWGIAGTTGDRAMISFQKGSNPPSDATKIDEGKTGSIVAWGVNGNVYWYSACDKVYFNQDSSAFFDSSKALTKVDLTGIDTSRVTNMEKMFQTCRNMTSLNLGNSFDTSNVTNMTSMFAGCKSLESIDVSSFNTGKVTLFTNMFSKCEKLTKMDISNFDTSSATNIASMFAECKALATVKLGAGFNTSKVENFSGMFFTCSSLTTIYAVKDFDTSSEDKEWSGLVFNGCSKLVGGAGYQYVADSDYQTSKFAKINTASVPGYFTKYDPDPTKAPTAAATATPTPKQGSNATATPTPKPGSKTTVTPTPKSDSKVTPTPGSSGGSSLTLDKHEANVVCGKTMSFKATLKGPFATPKWTSSDPKVATVSDRGVVTAKMAGVTTITVSANGLSDQCVVTVLYKDVTNSKDFWFAPTNYLTAKGVVKGYDKQTKFKPANKCTRAQMVTFIWRLQGEPSPKAKTCKFKDVKKTDYFYKACIWGNENKIVEGYKNGTFGPQIVCARRHAVTFLWRLAGQPKPSSTKNKFKDVKKTDYFYKACLWASEKGILAGYSDGTFKPNGDCLRRQMVTFLYKYDKYINGKG